MRTNNICVCAKFRCVEQKFVTNTHYLHGLLKFIKNIGCDISFKNNYKSKTYWMLSTFFHHVLL